MSQASPPASEIPAAPRRSSTERILELVLIGFCAVLFIFMLTESFRWSAGVALLPRIASGFGLFILIIYAVQRLRPAGASGQIMDMGFDEEGLARHEIVERTLRFVLSTALLFVGIYLVGFHISIPIYMLAYLLLYGQMRWYWAVFSAACFLVFMVVSYDMVIRATWPEPVIKIPLPGVRY